jgi:hypothetical protein
MLASFEFNYGKYLSDVVYLFKHMDEKKKYKKKEKEKDNINNNFLKVDITLRRKLQIENKNIQINFLKDDVSRKLLVIRDDM